jgi:hypothetical protein
VEPARSKRVAELHLKSARGNTRKKK